LSRLKNSRPAIEGFPRGLAPQQAGLVACRTNTCSPVLLPLWERAKLSVYGSVPNVASVPDEKSPVDQLMQGRKRKMGGPLHMSRSAQKRNKQSRALVLDPASPMDNRGCFHAASVLTVFLIGGFWVEF